MTAEAYAFYYTDIETTLDLFSNISMLIDAVFAFFVKTRQIFRKTFCCKC